MTTPDLSAIAARLAERDRLWNERYCSPNLSSEETAHKVADLNFELADDVRLLLDYAQQLDEARRWHYPENEEESEKLPADGGFVVVEFAPEGRLGVWTALCVYRQGSWIEGFSPIRRRVYRWCYALPTTAPSGEGQEEDGC